MTDSTFTSGINHDTWNFSQLIIKSRFAEALTQGIARYPIHRQLRYAARMEIEKLFDHIALDSAWRAQRVNTYQMMLDAETIFV